MRSPARGVRQDPDNPPLLMVTIDLTRKGGLKFANVTGANVGRKLAIVLDGKVHSAPNIRRRSPAAARPSPGASSPTSRRATSRSCCAPVRCRPM